MDSAFAAWIRRPRRRSAATSTLLSFPHAGGAASFYRPLAGFLDPSIEQWTVQYPAREDRSADAPATRVDQLVDGVVGAVERHLDRPIALFGHSMGATVAHRVARALERRGVAIEALFVSASGPLDTRAPTAAHLLDDDGLLAHLRSLGGTHVEVFDHPELVARLLPIVRADYRLLATARRPLPPLSAPIVAFGADDDPLASPADLSGWSRCTSGGFRRRIFPGGHFYLADEFRAVAGDMGRQLLAGTVVARGA